MISAPRAQKLLPQWREITGVIRACGKGVDEQPGGGVDVTGGVVKPEQPADQVRLVARPARRIRQKSRRLLVLSPERWGRCGGAGTGPPAPRVAQRSHR